jgi:hypothetical protein
MMRLTKMSLIKHEDESDEGMNDRDEKAKDQPDVTMTDGQKKSDG